MNLHPGISDQSPIISGHMPACAVIGAPRQVRERLLELREQFDADELMILTIAGDYAQQRLPAQS